MDIPLDMWDDFGDYSEECARKGNVTCKYCGQTGLSWIKTEKGWRLVYTSRGEPYGYHQCAWSDQYLEAPAGWDHNQSLKKE